MQEKFTRKEIRIAIRAMKIDGDKLRKLRTQKLWLIGDLAENSGVHRNLISNYELDKAGAHPHTIRKLAQALGVEPTELLKEDVLE